MKFLAFAAIAAAVSLEDTEDRALGKKAKHEASTYSGFETAQNAVFEKQKLYVAALAEARKQEDHLQREINETDVQEAKTKKANEAADKARVSLNEASAAAHKAMENYMNRMAADALKYSR